VSSTPRTRPLSGWGRCPVVEGVELLGEDLPALGPRAAIARGAGRSYGDASLPPRGGAALGTRLADRLLAFDVERGVLRAEAGLRLATLVQLARRHGWTCPVVPGTRHVTLGGMVAADVHGKNHHVAGTIGRHVRALVLQRADDQIVELVPDESREREPAGATRGTAGADRDDDPARPAGASRTFDAALTDDELLRATIGGMGWTGHIVEVELQLARRPAASIEKRTTPFAELDEGLRRLEEASCARPFTAAWLDGTASGRALGRGVLVSGEWTEAPSPPPRPRPAWRVPTDRVALVGETSIRTFNAAWRLRHRRPRATVVPFERFVWPLDAIGDLTRLFGPCGFVQHQSVVPGGEAVRALLEVFAHHGAVPALCVLKDCGEQGRGLLSFPRRGLSLAFDLPMRGPRTRALVDALDEQVLAHGGRVYLAKDALSRGEHLRAMDARLDAFAARKPAWDPRGRLRSALFERIFGAAA